MSLFEMQGMEAEDSKFRQVDGRTPLSTLSTAVVAGACRASTLSTLAGHC